VAAAVVVVAVAAVVPQPVGLPPLVAHLLLVALPRLAVLPLALVAAVEAAVVVAVVAVVVELSSTTPRQLPAPRCL
jgi:hypothetical protein